MEATASAVFSYPKLSKPTSLSLSLGEHVYIPPNNSSKMLLCQSISFMNRRMKFRSIKSFCIRAIDEDEKLHRSSDKQASRDRLLALLKHIKDSISEDESRSKNKTSHTLDIGSSDRTPVVEFFRPNLDTLIPNDNAKGDKANGDQSNPTPEAEPSIDFKSTRQPSNFIKRSPIPAATPLRGGELEVTNGAMPSTGAPIELPQFDAMKLGELKELAKEKGIRGYSKLKKSELVELLKSQIN